MPRLGLVYGIEIVRLLLRSAPLSFYEILDVDQVLEELEYDDETGVMTIECDDLKELLTEGVMSKSDLLDFIRKEAEDFLEDFEIGLTDVMFK